jgi:hypothetical protein
MGNGKKKLKKKLRLANAAAQGSPNIGTPVTSGMSQMMAALHNAQTVNKPDSVQLSASVQPHVQVSGELPSANAEVENEETDWTDEEEGNDGGSISANVSEVILETAPQLVVEVSPPILEAAELQSYPTSSQDVAPQAEISIDTQPEVNQENNMNVVNHPDVTANATPAPLTTAGNSIVAEGAMERMQTEANATPPAAETMTTSIPVAQQTEVEKKKPQAAFHNIQVTAMLTLDLTNFEFMTGLKGSLSRVDLGGNQLNLYSPFRKAGKKTETKPAAGGVMRHVLPGMLDLSDAVNNSRVMVVGGAADVQTHIDNAIEVTKKQIVNLFPVAPETVVASFVDTEAQQTIQMQLSDIVNIRSWTNSSAANTEEENIPFEIHNAVINATINAGSLYDAENRVTEIHRIIKTMEMIVAKREESNTTIVLAIAMDASTLADAAVREMLDSLLTEEDFALYSRQELLRLDDNDFLPQTRESVENDLLVEKADILLMRILTQDEEEVEADDGAEEAAATDATE